MNTAQAPAAAAAPALSTNPDVIDEANLLLFSVELDSLTLSESLTAYGAPEDPLVPLGELSRLMELDVDVQPADRRVVGRIGESRRSIALDLTTGDARNGPATFKLQPGEFAISQTEVYLRTSVLSKLLPLKFEINTEALAMKIVATEQLPIQGRLERLARLRDGSSRVQGRDEVLSIASPYRLFSLPAFDASLGAGIESGAGMRYPYRYDLRVAGDFGYMGYQGYLGSDESGIPNSARLTFDRRSLEGRLLGPLKVRQISIGDTYTPGLAIGPRSVGGRGFALSTVPLDQTNVFNRVDLRGELPVGYDVELYVNDVLRSGQNTPTQGRYEFLNVPLARGVNVIRIVSYGPRGERSEQTKIVNVGGGQLAVGEMTLELGAVQQETPLLRVRAMTAQDQLSQGEGGIRAVASINYGLTQYLTVNAGAAYYPPNSRLERQVYTLGARTSVFGVATQLDTAIDTLGGQAGSLSLAATIYGASLVGRHAEFLGGFFDENGPAAELTRPIARRSELTLDLSIPLANRIVPTTLRGLRTEYVDGVVDITASARVSTTLANILISSGLEFENLTSLTAADTTRLAGYFAASTFRDFKWQLRATVDYETLPEFRLRALAITADRDISPNWSLRFGLGQSLEDFNSVSVTASSIFRTRFADLALVADYNNADQSWRAGVQASFGLAYNGDQGRYQMTRPGAAAGGIVLFHAFIDANANGLFDVGEEPVPDVQIEGGERKSKTGKDGRVLITGVGAGPTARLNIGLDDVDNTYLKAPPAAVKIQPRAGGYTEVLYPMKPTGEVLVKILLKRPDGKLVGLSAVQIRLLGTDGKVAAEASTEFDGSVIFQELPVGGYTLELEPTQAARLRMRLNVPASVTIRGDGAFTPDVQAEVSFEARPEQQPQVSAPLVN